MLAENLEEILKKVRDRYAPNGRVDARTKDKASFAEKCLRKYHKYKDPLERMTDLGGAKSAVTSRAGQCPRASEVLFPPDCLNCSCFWVRLDASLDPIYTQQLMPLH